MSNDTDERGGRSRPPGNKTIRVGDEDVRLEPFSGRKAVRVIRTIERITKGVPEILEEWAKFTRDYEEANAKVMDRTAARYYFTPEPLMDERPVIGEDDKPIETSDGLPLMMRVPHLEDGKPVMGPDPLGHMTEEDWKTSHNQLRLPRSPTLEEKVAAVFPMALDLAEQEVTQLLALLATTNKELKVRARDGSLKEYLVDRAEDLLDAPATDLMELAVTAGELVEEEFTTKVKELGSRLPNVMRLLGLKPGSRTEAEETSSSSSSETKPISSTDSPSPTDGTSEPPSTVPVGASSEPSANA